MLPHKIPGKQRSPAKAYTTGQFRNLEMYGGMTCQGQKDAADVIDGMLAAWSYLMTRVTNELHGAAGAASEGRNAGGGGDTVRCTNGLERGRSFDLSDVVRREDWNFKAS